MDESQRFSGEVFCTGFDDQEVLRIPDFDITVTEPVEELTIGAAQAVT